MPLPRKKELDQQSLGGLTYYVLRNFYQGRKLMSFDPSLIKKWYN